MHHDSADDVAADEGVQTLEAGVTRQFVDIGQGRHRYGECRATALWAQQPEATRLGVHAASWSSLRMLHNTRECWGHVDLVSAGSLLGIAVRSELLLNIDFQVAASGVDDAFSQQRLHTIQR
jgi:hypothetical protein